tara:strand:- start:9250 stop:9429 length:180 start_codon:yes stop_codon:yes gene_type:complete
VKLKTEEEIIENLVSTLKKATTIDNDQYWEKVQELKCYAKALEWVLGIDKKGETKDVQE